MGRYNIKRGKGHWGEIKNNPLQFESPVLWYLVGTIRYHTIPYHNRKCYPDDINLSAPRPINMQRRREASNVSRSDDWAQFVCLVFENGFEGFEWDGKCAIWKIRKLFASVDSIQQRWRNGIPAMESVSRERVVSSFDPVVIRPKLFRFLQLSKGWHANFDNHAKYASFCDRAMEGFKREVECWMNGSLGIPLLLLLC